MKWQFGMSSLSLSQKKASCITWWFRISDFSGNRSIAFNNVTISSVSPRPIEEIPSDQKKWLPYSRYYKTPLYLFLRLFGASSIQEGLIFKKFLNWINKMGKIWQNFLKNSQFWIFFQYSCNETLSECIIMSRLHGEMFWGFQKGIIHVSIPTVA